MNTDSDRNTLRERDTKLHIQVHRQTSGVQRGCERCDGTGYPPWGHPRGQFSL